MNRSSGSPAVARVLADAKSIARRKYELHGWAWAQGAKLGVFPLRLTVAGFSGGELLDDQEKIVAAARQMAAYAGPGTVETTPRRWPGYGTQQVPHRIVFDAPSELARFANRSDDWAKISSRATEFASDWPGIGLLPRGLFLKISGLTGEDWRLLRQVLFWADGADTANLLARQLPVPGAHTKWVERFWPVIEALSVAGARTSAHRLEKLRNVEKMTTVGFLDPELRAVVGGLRVFAAQPTELADVPIQPTTVIICENLQNIHSFTDVPGTVVLAGKGFDIGAHVRITWVHTARVIYWGDLDTNGFAMLHRLRSYLPAAESILMDEATLLLGRELWVREPTPTRAILLNLNEQEQCTYQALAQNTHGDRVRLEQERIPWSQVVLRLVQADVPLEPLAEA